MRWRIPVSPIATARPWITAGRSRRKPCQRRRRMRSRPWSSTIPSPRVTRRSATSAERKTTGVGRSANPGAPGMLLALRAMVLADSSDRTAARQLLASLEDHLAVAPITPGMVAMAHVALGDTDTAFAWLESAFEKRDQILTTLKVDLAWD